MSRPGLWTRSLDLLKPGVRTWSLECGPSAWTWSLDLVPDLESGPLAWSGLGTWGPDFETWGPDFETWGPNFGSQPGVLEFWSQNSEPKLGAQTCSPEPCGACSLHLKPRFAEAWNPESGPSAQTWSLDLAPGPGVWTWSHTWKPDLEFGAWGVVQFWRPGGQS